MSTRPRRSERLHLQELDGPLAKKRFRFGEKGAADSASVEFRSHRDDVNFGGVGIVLMNRKESGDPATDLGDQSLHSIEVAPVLHDRFFDPEPIGQGTENLLADVGFAGLEGPDLKFRTSHS